MPRRPTPAAAEVEQVLAPIRRARARRERAEQDVEDAIRAAAAADPRPTNEQIGAEAGVTEGAVRKILRADRT